MDTVYSGVVSLRSLRLAIFFAELNQLELWGADIRNGYLQAKTKEKLFIIAGPEFRDLQGHLLAMKNTLYGTSSAGARQMIDYPFRNRTHALKSRSQCLDVTMPRWRLL